jgi:hypothetical protein
MSSPGVLNALRVIALSDAEHETPDAWYKSKCRWYSREFNTPLPSVMDMPVEVVLRTWYEDYYWNLKHGNEEGQEHLNQIIVNTLVNELPQFQAEIEKIEQEDDDWYEQEIAALHAKLESQNREIAKKTIKPDKNGILIDKPDLKPNLKDEYHISVNPVDEPVYGDDED